MLANKMITVLAVSVVLVFAAAFAAQAYNSSEGTYAPIFYTGKIIGIDPAYKTLVVQEGPGDVSYFTVIDNTSLVTCNKDISFNDLKIGETVSLFYFSESLGGTRFVKDLTADIKC